MISETESELRSSQIKLLVSTRRLVEIADEVSRDFDRVVELAKQVAAERGPDNAKS